MNLEHYSSETPSQVDGHPSKLPPHFRIWDRTLNHDDFQASTCQEMHPAHFGDFGSVGTPESLGSVLPYATSMRADRRRYPKR